MFVRLYTGEDGRSHLEELQYPPIPVSSVSLNPDASISFRRSPDGHFIDWHTAPRRQYIFILSGQMELVVGDGTVRRLSAGDALLAEDLTGEGHTTRAVGDRLSAIVPIAE